MGDTAGRETTLVAKLALLLGLVAIVLGAYATYMSHKNAKDIADTRTTEAAAPIIVPKAAD